MHKCAQVLYSYDATADTELDMKEGQIINILREDNSGWWQGEIDGRVGWFPFNYVSNSSVFLDLHSYIIYSSSSKNLT